MTVLGPVPAHQLGPTVMHEHCLVDLRWSFANNPESRRDWDADAPVELAMLSDLRRRPFSTSRDNLVLDDEELAARELGVYRAAGGRTVVDMTCVGLGRDPTGLRNLASATGLNLVMATGVYYENAHPEWVRQMSADELSDMMVDEVVEGVGETGVRCGVIGEIGLSGVPRGASSKSGPMTEEEEKVLRAAARASLRTGLAVSLHLDPREPRAAIAAIDVLESEGVEAARIIGGHMDQVQDLDYHRAVADRGVYVEYDSFGREHYCEEWGHAFDWGHDSWRVRFAKALIDEGHGDQLLFAQDICLKSDLRAFGGPGYAHVLKNIVPTLRSLGVAEAVIDRILVVNPARALAGDPDARC
jgi:phosphotriesterase-related protein